MKSIKTNMTLVDIETSKRVSVNIVRGTHGAIVITPKGYGDKYSDDGFGQPIVLELYNGELRVYVWGDINRDDPTHVIDLSNAKEERRNLE